MTYRGLAATMYESEGTHMHKWLPPSCLGTGLLAGVVEVAERVASPQAGWMSDAHSSRPSATWEPGKWGPPCARMP